MRPLLLALVLRVCWSHNCGTFVGWMDATLDGKQRQRYAIVKLQNGKQKLVTETQITAIKTEEE